MSLHLGKQIQKDLQDQGHSVVWLAQQMCCSRQHCYRIFAQPVPNIDILRRAQNALHTDYLSLLASSVKKM